MSSRFHTPRSSITSVDSLCVTYGNDLDMGDIYKSELIEPPKHDCLDYQFEIYDKDLDEWAEFNWVRNIVGSIRYSKYYLEYAPTIEIIFTTIARFNKENICTLAQLKNFNWDQKIKVRIGVVTFEKYKDLRDLHGVDGVIGNYDPETQMIEAFYSTPYKLCLNTCKLYNTIMPQMAKLSRRHDHIRIRFEFVKRSPSPPVP